MPNSYDFPVFADQKQTNKTTGVTTITKVKVGGGNRNWAGSQGRIKVYPLKPTNVSANSTRYFSSWMKWSDVSSNWEGQASRRYGSEVFRSVDDPNGLSKATLSVVNKLTKSNLNLLIVAGEGRETVAYIASRIGTLASALNSIRKGNFREAAQRLGTDLSQNATKRLQRNLRTAKTPREVLSNSWLEYVFGIKQIVSDVHGAMEAYHSTMQVGSPVEQRAKHTEGTTGTVYRVGMTGSVWSSEWRTLQQLGITNPVRAAWDLIPLSFVLDWFLPISSYFGQMDATLGLRDVFWWSSTTSWAESRAKSPSKAVESRTEYYSRVGVTTVVFSPSFSPNLNIGKLITSTALLQRTLR